MCSRKSSKVLALSLAVLLVASCSLWALPGLGGPFGTKATGTDTTAASTVPQQASSATESDVALTILSRRLDTLESGKRLSASDQKALHDELVDIREEYEIVKQDAEAKEARILYLEEENARQADEIAYGAGLLKKESKLRFLTGVDMTAASTDGKITYAIGGKVGLKGRHLMLTAGASYDLGDSFGIKSFDSYDADRMSYSTSLCWVF